MGQCQQPGQGERERRGVRFEFLTMQGLSSHVDQVTLWDLVKEGSLEKLTVVLDNLQNQVITQLKGEVK